MEGIRRTVGYIPGGLGKRGEPHRHSERIKGGRGRRRIIGGVS